jgi:hypothetical protein
VLRKRSKGVRVIIYYRAGGDNLDLSGNFTSLDAGNNTTTPMKPSKCMLKRTFILHREKGSIFCA